MTRAIEVLGNREGQRRGEGGEAGEGAKQAREAKQARSEGRPTRGSRPALLRMAGFGSSSQDGLQLDHLGRRAVGIRFVRVRGTSGALLS